jgi:hypothetical protein
MYSSFAEYCKTLQHPEGKELQSEAVEASRKHTDQSLPIVNS